MLVILKPRSGRPGRKIVVHPIETVSIGRSDWADITVATDRHMAAVHFRVTADHKSARISHLGRGTATYLNGRPVRDQTLTHGDIIVAGSTEYAVHIEAHSSSLSQSLPGPVAQRELSVQVERCFLMGDVEYVRSVDGNPDAPRQLLERVARRHDVYLVMNFGRAQLPVPAELNDTPDLLSVFPDRLRQANTLHCVPFNATTGSWFTQLWGKDALTTLISSTHPQAIVRAALGIFCRPSLLRREIQAPHQLSRLLAAAQALLVEADGPGWEMFRTPRDTPAWTDLGVSIDRRA